MCSSDLKDAKVESGSTVAVLGLGTVGLGVCISVLSHNFSLTV